ncbi:MAG: clostripain-related cysteine peptidase [Clostridia bacterium]|nr:clostripain-related cysteine peptidase [Clostridia bacterium]
MGNRPRGRTVTTGGGSGGAHKSGSGFSGHAGSGSFSGGFSGGGSHSSGGSSHSSGGSSHSSGGSYSGGGGYSGGTRSRGGIGCLPIIIIVLVLAFGGGGLSLSNLFGGSGDYQQNLDYGNSTYDGWYDGSNTAELNTDVSPQARDKYTGIRGNGQDEVTVMVYMCGTDLESNQAMATKDLNEMLSADIGDNLNLIVYTGGCKQWRNNTISSTHNQIWQIKGGNIECLVNDAGDVSMTRTDTLSGFIKWTNKNFPANRMDLILWDHGSGSINGYGYDQKFPGASLTLSGLKAALKDAGIKYDFIGFDACLMATSETALMLGDYADYMIGSEESEPGIGWYYTNWLTELSHNTSTPTLQTGKTIADDFTSKCASQCPGQSTTLSVTDLAELSQTLPLKLSAFASTASDMISDGDYKTVASARSNCKEFTPSAGLDQIDLVHFAKLMDNNASNQLAETVSDAVKYNRVSKNTANAYGLSIYFPFRSLNKVDAASKTYSDIGISDDYTDCIQKFAQMEVSGQAVSGGHSFNPFSLPSSHSAPASDDEVLGSELMGQLIQNLLSGNVTNFGKLGLDELNESNTNFLQEGGLTASEAIDTIVEEKITAEDLRWQRNADGNKCIKLTEKQWDSIETVDLEVFYDDGHGYFDLGLDNIYDFDDEGNLLPYLDKNWLAINGQTVAYYHTETLEKGGDNYVITGYVPIKLNGEKAKLILSFDQDNVEGYVAGVSYDYDKKVTETVAKTLPSLQKGDTVSFVADYYDYNGNFKTNYQIGHTITINNPDNITIRNIDLGSNSIKLLYKFTDIFQQEYWTPEIDL